MRDPENSAKPRKGFVVSSQSVFSQGAALFSPSQAEPAVLFPGVAGVAQSMDLGFVLAMDCGSKARMRHRVFHQFVCCKSKKRVV